MKEGKKKLRYELLIHCPNDGATESVKRTIPIGMPMTPSELPGQLAGLHGADIVRPVSTGNSLHRGGHRMPGRRYSTTSRSITNSFLTSVTANARDELRAR